jgi:hypothetical protein
MINNNKRQQWWITTKLGQKLQMGIPEKNEVLVLCRYSSAFGSEAKNNKMSEVK